MRPNLHPAPSALLALGLAVSGCGHQKVERSNKPVTVTTPAKPPATSTSPRTAPAAKAHSTTIVGSDVPTKFGDVQVSLTVKAGRITNVQWLKLPLDRPRSRYISTTAAPILRSEVLRAQSARINLVSGASYTSEGWANSVQSAIARER